MPRTLSLTPQIVEAVCAAIQQGLSRPEAFSAVGVPPSTRTRWLRRAYGREGRRSALLNVMKKRMEDSERTAFPARLARYEQERLERQKMQRELQMERMRAEVWDRHADILRRPPAPVIPPPVSTQDNEFFTVSNYETRNERPGMSRRRILERSRR